MAGISLQWLEEQRSLITAIVISLLPILMIFLRHRMAVPKKPKLPPSPFKLPIIGNLHQLGKLPHHSLRNLSLKHGPLMLLQLGHVPCLVVSSAEMAKEIMKTHDLKFANRPILKAAKQLFYDCKDIAFSPYGDHWREVRKICMVELLTTKRVQSFGFVREEEVDLLVEKISSSCVHSTGLVNLRSMFHSLTQNIICKVAFGRKYPEKGGGDGKSSFTELGKEMVELLGDFHMGDFFPSLGWMDALTGLEGRAKRVFQGLDGFLDQVIEDHVDSKRGESEQKDLVDVLLQVQKESNLIPPLTRDNLKAVILDIFVAGTDTTSTTLEWVMTELARHPHAMRKAQEEVRKVAHDKLKVEESDLSQLEYLTSTIKETLRLHPPLPLLVPRESIEDVEIQGYSILAKTRVYINAFAIARDHRSWDRADEFIPERFMNICIDSGGKDFESIPFGAGRRGCPGASFASPVIELALANLLNGFDWELPNGADPMDIDMTEETGLTVHKKTDLMLVAGPHFS